LAQAISARGTLLSVQSPRCPILNAMGNSGCCSRETKPTSAALERRSGGTTAKLVADGGDAKRDSSWKTETVLAHNERRRRHGAPPLVWDDELAAKAQLAADACAARSALFHSHHREYGHGQNAFFGTPGHFGAHEAIEAWYAEVVKPGYTWDARGSPHGCAGCGHFTQVVWKDCVKVGMACDRSGKGFIVANYWPPGNLQGNYHKQVLPAGAAMQARSVVRTKPFSGEVKIGSSTLKEIFRTLESAGQTVPMATIEAKLSDDWKVVLQFTPNPGGVLKYQCSKGGSTMSGSCTF